MIHVLDASGDLEGRDPLVDFATINDELNDYDPALARKPMLVALNKIDLPEAQSNLSRLRLELERKDFRVFAISAATGEGVQPLLNAVAETLRELAVREEEEAKRQAREPRVYTLEQVDERAWKARRLSQHHFEVTGVAIERFAKMTNWGLDDAVDRFQRVLDASGITGELERQGIESGDVVQGIREGRFDATHVIGELGEVLLGRVAGRRSADEVTVFKSLGMAVEDVAAADLVYRRAEDTGAGTALEL